MRVPVRIVSCLSATRAKMRRVRACQALEIWTLELKFTHSHICISPLVIKWTHNYLRGRVESCYLRVKKGWNGFSFIRKSFRLAPQTREKENFHLFSLLLCFRVHVQSANSRKQAKVFITSNRQKENNAQLVWARSCTRCKLAARITRAHKNLTWARENQRRQISVSALRNQQAHR